MSDFYVPDETIDSVLDAYERGEKGITAPPTERYVMATGSAKLRDRRGSAVTEVTGGFAVSMKPKPRPVKFNLVTPVPPR